MAWCLRQDGIELQSRRSLTFTCPILSCTTESVIVLLTAAAWSLCADEREELSPKGWLFRGIPALQRAARSMVLITQLSPHHAAKEDCNALRGRTSLHSFWKTCQRQDSFLPMQCYQFFISVDTACIIHTGCVWVHNGHELATSIHFNQFQACYPLNLDEIGWLKSYSLHLIKLLIEINGDSAWASTASFVLLPLQWSCAFVYVKQRRA